VQTDYKDGSCRGKAKFSSTKTIKKKQSSFGLAHDHAIIDFFYFDNDWTSGSSHDRKNHCGSNGELANQLPEL
jgi:hypothetical protein